MTIELALVGCGGMGLRHTHGIAEAKRAFGSLRLAAVCDQHEEAAAHIASEAERLMGHRPAVYTDLSEMLDRERNLDALDIVTDTRMHHAFAVEALEAGVNVITEKPLGITLNACWKALDAAEKSGRVLAVAENYRRDPMNRLAKALIDSGAIGTPNYLLYIAVSGGAALLHNTGWRALKSRAGSGILERGVHFADLILYFMGNVETVFAATDIFQRVRTRRMISENLIPFYGHRVEDEFAGQEEVEIDAEDTAMGVLTFESGAIGQLTMSDASHGYNVNVSSIHGNQGTLLLPPSRSGTGPAIRFEGREDPVVGDELLALAPDWEMDDISARLWPGERRIASYDMSFEEIDRKILAVELQDFAEAIENDRPPEVDGTLGMKALALAFAVLESGQAGRPVTMDEVLSGEVSAYQDGMVGAASG